jgi:hypothetical protein
MIPPTLGPTQMATGCRGPVGPVISFSCLASIASPEIRPRPGCHGRCCRRWAGMSLVVFSGTPLGYASHDALGRPARPRETQHHIQHVAGGFKKIWVRKDFRAGTSVSAAHSLGEKSKPAFQREAGECHLRPTTGRTIQ